MEQQVFIPIDLAALGKVVSLDIPTSSILDSDPLTEFTLLRRRNLAALSGQALTVPDG